MQIRNAFGKATATNDASFWGVPSSSSTKFGVARRSNLTITANEACSPAFKPALLARRGESKQSSQNPIASPDAVLGKQTEADVKKVRVFSNVVNQEVKKEEPKPTFFVFCEKTTGVAQFRAGSLADSDCTLDRVAGLFAMQCLVRGHDPNDFTVLVPADKDFVEKLVTRARDLLEEGRAVSGPASLSPRQQEILHSVLCNRANKEIASKLNITVRTVKFHISSLLSKFGVENRTELARRAAGLLRPTVLEGGASPASTQVPLESEQVRRELGPQPVNTNYRVENKTRVRFHGRVLTA